MFLVSCFNVTGLHVHEEMESEQEKKSYRVIWLCSESSAVCLYVKVTSGNVTGCRTRSRINSNTVNKLIHLQSSVISKHYCVVRQKRWLRMSGQFLLKSHPSGVFLIRHVDWPAAHVAFSSGGHPGTFGCMRILHSFWHATEMHSDSSYAQTYICFRRHNPKLYLPASVHVLKVQVKLKNSLVLHIVISQYQHRQILFLPASYDSSLHF